MPISLPVLAALAVLALCPPPGPSELRATFTVGAERYHVRLADPEDIAGARALYAGESEAAIPVGAIVRGEPDVNSGYTWHVDPRRFVWAEYAVATCDGLPSDVESGMVDGRFCPWSAKLVDLRPVRDQGYYPP